MSLPDILAALDIFVLLPMLVTMAVMLWRRSRARPRLVVLRSDAFAATVLTAYVAVIVTVFLNNGMDEPILGPYQTMVLTRAALFALAPPVAIWLWIYRPRKL